MNTGIQASSATPQCAWTITTPSGRSARKKNIMEIMAAHRIPYAATASVGYPQDLMDKVQKAKSIEGTKFLHILTPCATGWRMAENLTVNAAMLSVETRLFPLYEIFDGKKYAITYDPQGLPVEEYLKIQGRYRQLEDAEQIERMQRETDEEWERSLQPRNGLSAFTRQRKGGLMSYYLNYEGGKMDFSLPPSWNVLTCQDCSAVCVVTDVDKEIERALDNPIGSPPLEDLARPGMDVVVLFDDVQRPTPAYLAFPHILNRLNKAGIPDERISGVCALGTHPQLYPGTTGEKGG